MELNIDPGFSVYSLTERVQRQSTTVNHRRTMNIISYEIENVTLKDNAKTRIFASFQRMSKFLPQMKRYRKMATIAQEIYVFGIPDIELPYIPNITYVPLKPTDRLAQEWFLVSYNQDYASALATEEISYIDDPDEERLFKGVWTFDVGLIAILEEWLASSVNAEKMLHHDNDHNYAQQLQFVNQTINRLLPKVMGKTSIQPKIQLELKTLLNNNLYPYMMQNVDKHAPS